MTVIPVQPIGSHRSMAFVTRTTGCGLAEVEAQEFPSENVHWGQALRDFRLTLDLSLREAANVLGLSAVDMSSLERGRATLAEPDKDEAMALLARERLKRGARAP